MSLCEHALALQLPMNTLLLELHRAPFTKCSPAQIYGDRRTNGIPTEIQYARSILILYQTSTRPLCCRISHGSSRLMYGEFACYKWLTCTQTAFASLDSVDHRTNLGFSKTNAGTIWVRGYRLHYIKHYIISLSDNCAQTDDRVWSHSDKCRENAVSVSMCCNIYRSHAPVKKLGSLHNSVTSPVKSV